MSAITIIGVNYYPEESAIGLYTTQMAEYLAKKHDITVITGFPYYPEWKINKTYNAKPRYMQEHKKNICIYRYKQYVPNIPTFKKRVLHLLDFTFGSVYNVFKIKRSDLVICIVPFTSSIVLGLLLAKLRGAKVWVHIQDFEFDAAVESGLAGEQNKVKTKLFQSLFWLEKKLLNKADIVSTISYGMLEKLKSKTEIKSFFFPNWVDEDFINPENTLQHELINVNKFTVLYSGNIGAKQDWEFFVRIVKYFEHDMNIEFVVIGAGVKKAWLVSQTKNMDNIRHYPPVEYSRLPDLLCSADLHVLFQKNDIVDTVMPSKILGMMASARVSLVTGNIESEVAKVFEKSQGGYFFNSQCFNEVIHVIEELSINKQKSSSLGKNARHYITKYFSASEVLENFETRVQEVLNTKV